MRIKDIKIGKRHRKNLGDIEALAESIKRIGLLHPVVVERNSKELIAGRRRIEAYKLLGKKNIPDRKLSLDNIARGEFDENALRKDFTASEKVDIIDALVPKEKEKAKERQKESGKRHGKGLEKFSKSIEDTGRALEKAAKKEDWSRPTYKKAKEVVKAARENPDKYGDLIELLDKSVVSTYNELKKRQEVSEREKKLAKAPELKNLILGNCLEKINEIPDGSIDALITDPPYGINFKSEHRIIENINVKLVGDTEEIFIVLKNFFDKVNPKLKDNAHIYIFTSWKVLHKLHPLVNDHFDVKTCIVWDKGNWSGGDLYGNYAEGYELILFATKGKRRFNCEKRPVNIIEAKRPTNNPNRLYHPTEKPVELLKTLITNSTVEGETVLDPFAGSGSTLVAAEGLGRNWWGIELEKRWHDVARSRILEARNNGGE